jgi:hypothetical protein
MTNIRLVAAIAISAVTLSSLLFYAVFLRGNSAIADDQLQELVYVDQETGEAFLLRARSSPEYHPETGDPTLIPGMYCEKCRRWKAVGPLEVLQTGGVPHRCPIHKTPLLREGPLPEEL